MRLKGPVHSYCRICMLTRQVLFCAIDYCIHLFLPSAVSVEIILERREVNRTAHLCGNRHDSMLSNQNVFVTNPTSACLSHNVVYADVMKSPSVR